MSGTARGAPFQSQKQTAGFVHRQPSVVYYIAIDTQALEA